MRVSMPVIWLMFNPTIFKDLFNQIKNDRIRLGMQTRTASVDSKFRFVEWKVPYICIHIYIYTYIYICIYIYIYI